MSALPDTDTFLFRNLPPFVYVPSLTPGLTPFLHLTSSPFYAYTSCLTVRVSPRSPEHVYILCFPHLYSLVFSDESIDS